MRSTSLLRPRIGGATQLTMPCFPKSTTIARAEYDPYTRELELWFRESGDRSVYRGVPAAVWRELLEANSKGRYFDSNIRDRFSI